MSKEVESESVEIKVGEEKEGRTGLDDNGPPGDQIILGIFHTLNLIIYMYLIILL